MTDLVDPSEVETVVGTGRHDFLHYGRAKNGRVVILHSRSCKRAIQAAQDDLRICRFSRALDEGLMVDDIDAANRGPVELDIREGMLVLTGRTPTRT